MIITKKLSARRTFLRGLGTTLALAAAGRDGAGAWRDHATRAKPAVRLGFVYVPNGIIHEGLDCRQAEGPASNSRRP